MGKLLSESDLFKIWDDLKGKRGYTCGSFDIFHRGHLEYLKAAKQKCDFLIVGINSDKSVKGYKSGLRPIISQDDRAALIAELQFVDYVFIFDDLKQARILEKFKPDFYIKAGDYDLEKLTSAHVVQSYGGEVVFIPFLKNYSTTRIINNILDVHGIAQPETVDLPVKPAIFLDRDGVIIKDVNYPHDPKQVELIPGVGEFLAKLQDKFYLVIVTNQPGIGFGYYTKEDFFKVNLEMLRQLNQFGIKIHKIYYCPHTQAEECECRKPNTKLFERACGELPILIDKSWMIGDKQSDIDFGKKCNLKTALLSAEIKSPDSFTNYEELFQKYFK